MNMQAVVLSGAPKETSILDKTAGRAQTARMKPDAKPPYTPEEIEEICRRLDALKEPMPEPMAALPRDDALALLERIKGHPPRTPEQIAEIRRDIVATWPQRILAWILVAAIAWLIYGVFLCGLEPWNIEFGFVQGVCAVLCFTLICRFIRNYDRHQNAPVHRIRVASSILAGIALFVFVRADCNARLDSLRSKAVERDRLVSAIGVGDRAEFFRLGAQFWQEDVAEQANAMRK